MASTLWFLDRLALDSSADERAVRRAYARELKRIDPEADPAGFQSLREAYEAALHWFSYQRGAHSAPVATNVESPPAEPEQGGKFGSSVEAQPVELPTDTSGSEDGREVLGPGPHERAEAVFAEFTKCFADSVSAPDSISDAAVQRDLAAAQHDPRLAQFEAHNIFEQQVAELLAGGWRPGHEALFLAAARVFDWNRDKKRLARLGHAGMVLNRAIEERTMFEQLSEQVRRSLRAIIVRLRSSVPPSNRELMGGLLLAEWAVKHFPVWIPLITSTDNLASWQQFGSKLPGWRRRLAHKFAWRPPDSERPSSTHQFRLLWVLIVVVALVKLMAGVSHSANWTGQSATSGDEQNRSFGRSLLSDSTVIQPAPRPVGKALLADILGRSPSRETCSEVAVLAVDRGMDDTISGADLGREFDRRVIRCAAMHLWPHNNRIWNKVLLGALRRGEIERMNAREKRTAKSNASK